MTNQDRISTNNKPGRSIAGLALAAAAAGIIVGSVGHAVAGSDYRQPVSITTSEGITRASGSMHDARFYGGASDYIGCINRWGTNWLECFAQMTLSNGGTKYVSCGINTISSATSYNQGVHWLSMLSMINETSGITFAVGSDGKCIPTDTSVWNSSDYL